MTKIKEARYTITLMNKTTLLTCQKRNLEQCQSICLILSGQKIIIKTYDLQNKYLLDITNNQPLSTETTL